MLNYIPAILWSGIIFMGCLIPGNDLPKEDFLDKIYFDKIVHLFMYFILLLLVVKATVQQIPSYKKQLLVASAICISQGILIECLQGSHFIQHRSFEIWDIVANITGVGLGILFIQKKHKTN